MDAEDASDTKRKKTQKGKMENPVKSSRPIDMLLSPYAFQVSRCPMLCATALFDTITSYLNVEGLLEYSEAFKLIRSCMAIGVNECVRRLEKNKELSILLIDSDLTCTTFSQHLIAACAVRSCPVLLVTGLTQFLVKMNGNGNYICVAFKNDHLLPESVAEQLESVKSQTIPINNPDKGVPFVSSEMKTDQDEQPIIQESERQPKTASVEYTKQNEVNKNCNYKSVEGNDGQIEQQQNHRKSESNDGIVRVKGFPVVSNQFQSNHQMYMERNTLLGAMKTDRPQAEKKQLFELYSTEGDKNDYLRREAAQSVIKESMNKKKKQSEKARRKEMKREAKRTEQLANKKKMVEQIKKGYSVTAGLKSEIKQPEYIKADFSRTKPS